MANQPQAIPSAWAANNSTTNSIPATTTESGKASWDQGFPVETSLPLSVGGIPPKYGDFNGVLKVLSQFCLFAQEGGQFAYDATVDYTAGALVQGSDNALYECLIANGPGSTVVNPVGDTSGKWGRLATASDLAGYALDSAVVKLAGAQAITGAKTFTSAVVAKTDYGINRGVDNAEIRVCGGTDITHGASLMLYGKDKTSIEGIFRLRAHDGTNYSDLLANPSGSLTWAGKGFVYDSTNQTIAGDKTFSGQTTFTKEAGEAVDAPILLKSAKVSAAICMVDTTVSKGTNPSATRYWGIHAYGNTYSNQNNRLGCLDVMLDTSGTTATTLRAWRTTSLTDSINAFFSVYMWKDGNGECRTNAGLIRANVNNGTSIGASNLRFKEIWCGQNSINTSSDERIKQQIAAVPDAVLDAWEDINWIQFKFNDACEEKGADKARLHNGLIAQRVDEAFKTHGLDASAYGLFLYDTWDALPEEKDEQGNITQKAMPAGEGYGLRYTEALCMEAAYQRRRADRAEARISALEQRLGELEAVLASLISPVGEEQTAEQEQ